MSKVEKNARESQYDDLVSRGKGVIASLQAAKVPMDAERTALQQELKKLVAKRKEKEEVLRVKIRAMHNDIAPIDRLLSSAVSIPEMIDLDIAEVAMEKLIEKVEAV